MIENWHTFLCFLKLNSARMVNGSGHRTGAVLLPGFATSSVTWPKCFHSACRSCDVLPPCPQSNGLHHHALPWISWIRTHGHYLWLRDHQPASSNPLVPPFQKPPQDLVRWDQRCLIYDHLRRGTSWCRYMPHLDLSTSSTARPLRQRWRRLFLRNQLDILVFHCDVCI